MFPPAYCVRTGNVSAAPPLTRTFEPSRSVRLLKSAVLLGSVIVPSVKLAICAIARFAVTETWNCRHQ